MKEQELRNLIKFFTILQRINGRISNLQNVSSILKDEKKHLNKNVHRDRKNQTIIRAFNKER